MGLLRKAALKLLKITAFDTTIKHHFTKCKFMLNTYNHKGYWFYGTKREENTIKQFQAWIKPNDFVLEIGAHIGYFSTFYANLVGENGKVTVFEPSDKNAKYLNKNIGNLPEKLRNVVLVVNKGAGDIDGQLNFYIDPITGQNNSFVENFEGFYSNRENSADSDAQLIKEVVQVIKLDTFFKNETRFPNFVKIDVEGFEWNVIQGFINTIENHHPSLMIEIQADSDKIIPYFIEKGYAVYNDKMTQITSHLDYISKKSPNIFFKYTN